MPIYEFICEDCGNRFSKFFRAVSSAEEGECPSCPECASLQTHRALSSFAIHGPAGMDVRQVAAENAQAQREASVTSKDQINKWRGAKKN